MAEKMGKEELREEDGSSSWFYSVVTVFVGLILIRRIFFSSKKKSYYSGLHRDVTLTRGSIVKQNVVRHPDGSTTVRPSEGPTPNVDLVDYDSYSPPFTGTTRDYVGTERKSQKGMASQPAKTVMSIFKRAVERAGDRPALRSCEGRDWTWKQYYAESCDIAKSLIVLGFEAHDCTNIIGFNSPEWLIMNMGTIAAGGMASGVYATNNTEACSYIAKHSKAKVIAVENLAQLAKYESVVDELVDCKAFVIWERGVKLDAHKARFKNIQLYTFDQFLNLGKKDEKATSTLSTRISAMKTTEICTLIYTSGTTGNPKAVSLTHDNITWTAATVWSILAGEDDLSNEEGGVRIISYLPLSHIAAQMIDIHAIMFHTALMENSACTHFADAGALRGSLLDSLLKVRPTYFFGVPRVWEKFQAKMAEKARDGGALTKALSRWARSKGMEMLAIRQDPNYRRGKKYPRFWSFAKLILNKVRERTGLDRCRICLTGAAPINASVLEFFSSLDIPVLELFGMSESTGPTTISHLYGKGFKIGSCGPPILGTEIHIHHVSNRDKTGEGEIWFRGRHIMAGYLNEPAKTKEAIDEKGWLHSGDVGRADDYGLIYITGRIKELLIGSGGENVAPVPIEERIKTACEVGLSNFVMIGDKRKYFVALATPKCVPNLDGSYSTALDPDALKIDPECTTAIQASKSPKWRKYIQDAIDDYNKKHAVSQACKIVKFEILPKDFSIPTDEIGPTLKLKRTVVNEKYADVIESMYPPE